MRVELARTDNRPYVIDGESPNAIEITALHIKDDSWTIQRSRMAVGINKHSKKSWSRWTTDSVSKVKRGKRGQLVPLTFKPRLGFCGGFIAYNEFVSASKGRWQSNEELLGRVMDEISIQNAPMASKINLRAEAAYGPKGGFDLIQRDPKDYVQALFGKSRYRKDLAKATLGADLDIALLASTMRDMVPTDWIIGFMKSVEAPRMTSFSYLNNPLGMRDLVKRAETRTLKRLLSSDHVNLGEMQDVIRFHHRIPAEAINNARNWDDLHRALGSGTKMEANSIIEESSLSKKIDEAFEGSPYAHIPAQTTNQLWNWSSQMSNCIRSYSGEAVSGMVILGAIEYGGKMIANYEVLPNGRLKQLLGKFNKALPKEHLKIIEGILYSAGVDVSRYWGKHPSEQDYEGV